MTEYKIYDFLPDNAKFIRICVFVDEQGFKEEFDDIDNYAKHIVLYNNKKPAAVGRFYTDDGKTYHIGRIAVMKEYRNCGYGKILMDIALNEITKIGGKRIELSAQMQAKEFYEKCGYQSVGKIYYDEHCPHILMKKDI